VVAIATRRQSLTTMVDDVSFLIVSFSPLCRY
jgi:hypothetical protein